MTSLSAASMRAWKDMAQTLAGVVVVIYFGMGFLHWVTGGVRPAEQVQVQQLASNVVELTKQIKELSNKFEQMPQPREIAAMNQELGGLRSRVDTLSDTVAQHQGILSRLDLGTDTPVRQPRPR